jgi:DinB superfamily
MAPILGADVAYDRDVTDGGGQATYSVTLEHGADGVCVAWVDDLPGCAVRAASKADALRVLPDAIREFVAWTGGGAPENVRVRVGAEVESPIEAAEDTEVLVEADRSPLTTEEWSRTEGWLSQSRTALLDLLARLPEEALDVRRDGSERTVRQEIEHVALVELMYAAWTFDVRSRAGLDELLAWTRVVAAERLQRLSEEGAGDLTWADWAGAPRPEPWTPRKAARRLVWHELLHLRGLERLAEHDADPSYRDADPS